MGYRKPSPAVAAAGIDLLSAGAVLLWWYNDAAVAYHAARPT